MKFPSSLNVPTQLALAWYDEVQWNLLRDLSVDPEDLDDSFQDWEVAAIETESELLAQGHDVSRIPIKADELVAWCRANRQPLNRAARSQFALELARANSPANEG